MREKKTLAYYEIREQREFGSPGPAARNGLIDQMRSQSQLITNSQIDCTVKKDYGVKFNSGSFSNYFLLANSRP